MGHVFQAITWLCGWIAVSALAVSAAAGLYVACDLAEEYSSTVRKYLNASICGIIAGYLLLILDGLPVRQAGIGILAHVCYLPLMSTFPLVELSVPSVWAVLITLGNHASWFYWFVHEWKHHPTSAGVEYPGWKVLGFLFVFVWSVPLTLFTSLISAEECLPAVTPGAGGYDHGGKKKRGIFKGCIDGLLEKKERLFPGSQKRRS